MKKSVVTIVSYLGKPNLLISERKNQLTRITHIYLCIPVCNILSKCTKIFSIWVMADDRMAVTQTSVKHSWRLIIYNFLYFGSC